MKVIENDNMTFSIPEDEDYEELYKDFKIWILNFLRM
jgi:hypothetical protein